MTSIQTFRWRDFLSFALPACVLTGAAIASSVNGKNKFLPAIIGMWMVAVIAWAIYGYLLYKRWKRSSGVTFVTGHGMPVIAGGRPVTREQVEAEVERTFDLWGIRAGTRRPIPDDVRGVVLVFRDFPFASHGKELAGLQQDNVIVVGWRANLAETALGHELGHFLYRYVFNFSGDFHEFEKAKNLG
jgi:hypothetical protein